MVALFLLLSPFAFYLTYQKEPATFSAVDRALVFVSWPVTRFFGGTIDGVGHIWRHYLALVSVEAENTRLQAHNLYLTGEVIARDEQVLENRRLRALLRLTERAPGVELIASRVIGTAPSPLYRSIRVDQGSDAGVMLGAAVLSAEGVVGRVARVGPGTSDVMLLIDPQSSTDILVQRTRARGRVRGEGPDAEAGLEVQYLARTADVVPGDMLITSGLSTIFAKGLVVGQVTKVERRAFGLYQRARLRPAVDFARLEEVLIVKTPAAPEHNYETPDSAPSSSDLNA